MVLESPLCDLSETFEPGEGPIRRGLAAIHIECAKRQDDQHQPHKS